MCPWQQLRISRLPPRDSSLAAMFFHFADRTKNQKLLPAIYTRSTHVHETTMTFSRACDFVFLASLKYSLFFRHLLFHLRISRKIRKAQQCWAFQFRVLAHLCRVKLYKVFCLRKHSKTRKLSRLKRKNRTPSHMRSASLQASLPAELADCNAIPVAVAATKRTRAQTARLPFTMNSSLQITLPHGTARSASSVPLRRTTLHMRACTSFPTTSLMMWSGRRMEGMCQVP